MVSLKKSIIFTLLLLIVIPAQNATALTHLPDSSYYSGKQYYPVFGGDNNDWIRVEFAVYDNGGAEFTDAGYDLPTSWVTDPCDFVYAYQVINDSDGIDFPVDIFSIYGIGENAITSFSNIGSTAEEDKGTLVYDESYSYFSSAWWGFYDPVDLDQENLLPLSYGEHSSFLLIKSANGPKAGTYNFQPPQGDDVPVPEASEPAAIPNPEPCTLALLGLGSALLLKRQRKK